MPIDVQAQVPARNFMVLAQRIYAIAPIDDLVGARIDRSATHAIREGGCGQREIASALRRTAVCRSRVDGAPQRLEEAQRRLPFRANCRPRIHPAGRAERHNMPDALWKPNRNRVREYSPKTVPNHNQPRLALVNDLLTAPAQ